MRKRLEKTRGIAFPNDLFTAIDDASQVLDCTFAETVRVCCERSLDSLVADEREKQEVRNNYKRGGV